MTKKRKFITRKLRQFTAYALTTHLELKNLPYPSLEWIPNEMPELEVFSCENTALTSLIGFSTKTPKLHRFVIRNCPLTSLEGLPSKMPELRGFGCEKTQISSLVGFPAVLPNLAYVQISESPLVSLTGLPVELPNLETLILSHCHLTSLTGLPPRLPKLIRIEIDNNALTSLHGLPPIICPLASEMVTIDVRNNYLENLAGLPSLYRPGHYQGEYQFPTLHLEGNPLRSLHGIPRRLLFSFTVSINYSIEFRCEEHLSPFFSLLSDGDELLETCINENELFFQHSQTCEEGEDWESAYRQDGLNPDHCPRSWHDAYDALFEYYRLSPLELTYHYLKNTIPAFSESFPFPLKPDMCGPMSEDAIERLKYEGGPIERQLLENYISSDDPVLEAIQTRLSIRLDSGQRFLL